MSDLQHDGHPPGAPSESPCIARASCASAPAPAGSSSMRSVSQRSRRASASGRSDSGRSVNFGPGPCNAAPGFTSAFRRRERGLHATRPGVRGTDVGRRRTRPRLRQEEVAFLSAAPETSSKSGPSTLITEPSAAVAAARRPGTWTRWAFRYGRAAGSTRVTTRNNRPWS